MAFTGLYWSFRRWSAIVVVCQLFLPRLSYGQQRQPQPLYDVESELVRSLFVNYSTQVPPQVSHDVPVSVYQDYLAERIVFFNERFSYVSIWMTVSLAWKDARLAWSSKNIDVKTLTVPSTDVWMPDLQVMTGSKKESNQGSKVAIEANGTVVYSALWEVDIYCIFDMTDFPFDEQKCKFVLSSWSNDITKVHFETPTLNFHSLNETELLHHQDWITEVSVAGTYGDKGVWQGTEVTLKLTRKANYYYRMYVAPAVVIIFSVPLIHLLPPGSHEKMTLATLLLLCVTFMLGLLVNVFPAFTETLVPKVVLFYTADLVLLFLSMFVAAISTAVAHKGGVTRPVPGLMKRYLIDKLSFLCCVRAEDAPSHLNYLAGWLAKWNLVDEQIANDRSSIINQAAPMATDDRDRESAADSEASKLLRILVAELQYGRYREQLRLEWLQLALIIDRALALAFFGIAIVVTFGFAH